MEMTDFVRNSVPSFMLPLPSPGQLHCSKELAFFANVSIENDTTNSFEENLCLVTQQSKKKSFKPYREYCMHENESESSFLSLLQYLQQTNLIGTMSSGQTNYLLLIGGTWRAAQFLLLEELCPNLEVHLWSSKIENSTQLPSFVKRKYGFPSQNTYKDIYPVHVFSELRSYASASIMPDLNAQKTIIDNCHPLTASLRFRPPFRKDFGQDNLAYFDGEMRTICYGGPSNITTRIFLRRQLINGDGETSPSIVRRAALQEEIEAYPKKTYALFDFEQILNHYNTEVRSIKRWNYNNFKGSFDDCYRTFILESVLDTDDLEEITVFWDRIVNACRGLSPKL